MAMGVEGASVVSATPRWWLAPPGWTNFTAAQLSSANDSRADTGTNTSATGTVRGFLFSSVPSSALIQGFVVTLEASESNTAVNGYLLTAISSNSGTSYSANYRSPDSGEFPTADTSYTEGGASDLWGLSWTVNTATANLRVKIVAYDASGTAGNVTRLDYVTTTIYFDSAPPTACTTLNSVQSSTATGQANLTWTASGEDGSTGTLNGNFRIQYATFTASWSTSTTPSGATTVTIATSSVTPGTSQSQSITGLTLPTTYYFVLWTQDASSRWSSISNTTSTLMDLTAPSTSTLASTSGVGQVTLNWNSAGDNGSTGNLTGNYRIQHATYTATWSTTTTPSNATTVTVSTTNATPGGGITSVVTGLSGATTCYFALFTQDDVGNWSGVSNTTSAVPTSQFDLNQIEVDGLNGGLKYGGVAWGDFDIDGDLDILVSGMNPTTHELRVYFNNGNGTFNPDQIDVAGATNGLRSGAGNWGDFDNDGDLDILSNGALSNSLRKVRVFSNNGNSTFNSTPLELAGDNGLEDGNASWGDFDNDGDLDVLSNGYDDESKKELRVYANTGNATFATNHIDIDGAHNGYAQGDSIWGDFDRDGDLDIAVDGSKTLSGALSVYINNGNGTFNTVEISPLGGTYLTTGRLAWGDYDNDADLDLMVSGGLSKIYIAINNGNGTFNPTHYDVDPDVAVRGGSVAWGDYDLDGDLDILGSGAVSLTYQLRIYKNNGNATFDPSQIEVDGLNNGLDDGRVAWGDHDNDGDIDILCNGDNVYVQLRVYKNLLSTPNTAPAAPVGLAATWAYNVGGISTATFKWSPASDSGTGATPANVLTYQLEVSTSSTFSGVSVAPAHWATPGMGNYLRPPLIFDGNTKHGVRLNGLKQTNTTYYFRVKTIDAGLKSSDWSASSSVYALVASSVPSAVVNLATASVQGDGQVVLTWTAPLNINAGGTASYDLRYSTTGAISNDTQFNNATALTGEPVPGNPGFPHIMPIGNLNPFTTHYFAIKSSNALGTSPLDVSSMEPSFRPNFFDSTQIDVGGPSGGLSSGDLSWGDFDNDGDLDVLAIGVGSDGKGLKVYKNNGNSTIDDMEIDVAGVNNGLESGTISLGDYDNDGDLDIAVNGYTGTYKQFRIYVNNGNGTFNPNQIEVDGVNNGYYYGDLAWGDFDNDGDLDLAVTGTGGQVSGRQLSIYKNNGNGTINQTQIDIEGLSNGLEYSSLAWGDFDNDGDLDLLAQGAESSIYQRRVYKNNGNGTIDASQIEVSGGLRLGGTAWGDFDADGDLDLLSSGETYLYYNVNNGNGTIGTKVSLPGGTTRGDVAWGDYDNDGDLDVLVTGTDYNSFGHIKVHGNNGNGTFSPDLTYIDGKDFGILIGRIAWGDFENDGDIDILAMGTKHYSSDVLGIYKNMAQLGRTNTAPSAPASLTSSWAFGGQAFSSHI
ncbi:MAG: VCBS repeat-containing protein [Elusimicrobia bacterium]|nr:VCBS repeat-containing protein [Elusimicrobiota bacterium]